MLDAMKFGYTKALEKLKNPYRKVLKSTQPTKLSRPELPKLPVVSLPGTSNANNRW